MPKHLCSTCLGIPLEHAQYVVADLFSNSPSTTYCPHSCDTDGIVVNNEIAAIISDYLLDCYYPHELGDDLRACLTRDFHFFTDVYNVDQQLDIIEALFGSDSKGHYRLKDNNNFRQKIDDFHEELKASRRFFSTKTANSHSFLTRSTYSSIQPDHVVLIPNSIRIQATSIAHDLDHSLTQAANKSHTALTTWVLRRINSVEEVGLTLRAYHFFT